MPMNLPSSAPKHALSTLAEEFDAMITEFANDASGELRQATDLMRDAIGDIDRSFRAIDEQHRAGRARLDELLAQSDRDQVPQVLRDALSKALTGSGAGIEESVGTAVRALQFEDMVRQILEHVIDRMGQLSRVTRELAAQAAQDPDGDCRQQLSHLRDRLAADRLRLRQDRHRAVTQSSMDEGDIELF